MTIYFFGSSIRISIVIRSNLGVFFRFRLILISLAISFGVTNVIFFKTKFLWLPM